LAEAGAEKPPSGRRVGKRSVGSRSLVETPERGLRVRVSDPTLVTELQVFLTSMLACEVRERRNHVEVVFAAGVDAAGELARVERLAWVWRAGGHPHVRTEVALIPADLPVADSISERLPERSTSRSGS